MTGSKRLKPVLPVLIGVVGLAFFFQNKWLVAREYIFASNIDNQDHSLPLHLYFIESLHQGHLACLIPYILSGSRLIGDPNFQLSPLHIVAALALSRNVPYGRITTLLGLFSVAVTIKTLFHVLESRRMQLAFATYLCIVTIACLKLDRIA